jgi:hypothetical protein
MSRFFFLNGLDIVIIFNGANYFFLLDYYLTCFINGIFFLLFCFTLSSFFIYFLNDGGIYNVIFRGDIIDGI